MRSGLRVAWNTGGDTGASRKLPWKVCGVELALGGFEVLDCSPLSVEHLLWLASLKTLVGPELMH